MHVVLARVGNQFSMVNFMRLIIGQWFLHVIVKFRFFYLNKIRVIQVCWGQDQNKDLREGLTG